MIQRDEASWTCRTSLATCLTGRAKNWRRLRDKNLLVYTEVEGLSDGRLMKDTNARYDGTVESDMLAATPLGDAIWLTDFELPSGWMFAHFGRR